MKRHYMIFIIIIGMITMLMGCASSSNVAEDTAEGIPISRAQFENFALQMGGEETTQVWTYTRS